MWAKGKTWHCGPRVVAPSTTALDTDWGQSFIGQKNITEATLYAYVDNEDVMLGDDYYMMEHGTCNDKAKEIVGWGQVTCKEVNVEEDENWFEHIIHQITNHNNN